MKLLPIAALLSLLFMVEVLSSLPKKGGQTLMELAQKPATNTTVNLLPTLGTNKFANVVRPPPIPVTNVTVFWNLSSNWFGKENPNGLDTRIFWTNLLTGISGTTNAKVWYDLTNFPAAYSNRYTRSTLAGSERMRAYWKPLRQ